MEVNLFGLGKYLKHTWNMNAYNDFTFVFVANCVFDNLQRQLGSNIQPGKFVTMFETFNCTLRFTYSKCMGKTLFCLFLSFLYINFKAYFSLKQEPSSFSLSFRCVSAWCISVPSNQSTCGSYMWVRKIRSKANV